jgi:hypothetical protein
MIRRRHHSCCDRAIDPGWNDHLQVDIVRERGPYTATDDLPHFVGVSVVEIHRHNHLFGAHERHDAERPLRVRHLTERNDRRREPDCRFQFADFRF